MIRVVRRGGAGLVLLGWLAYARVPIRLSLGQRLALSGDASFFANMGGHHAFKAGVQFQRIRNDVFSAEQAPHITFELRSVGPHEQVHEARTCAGGRELAPDRQDPHHG